MTTFSIRTLSPINPKAKAAVDERACFFREQYRSHSLSLAGKKNLFGRVYSKIEGGNHTSRKALRGALERLAEPACSPQETDVVLIADYAFTDDGLEEEKRIVKEGDKEKIVKDYIEREGVLRLIERFGTKFRRFTVLFEKSPKGPNNGAELDKHIASLQQAEASGKDDGVRVLHSQNEVTSATYASFVKACAGMTP